MGEIAPEGGKISDLILKAIAISAIPIDYVMAIISKDAMNTDWEKLKSSIIHALKNHSEHENDEEINYGYRPPNRQYARRGRFRGRGRRRGRAHGRGRAREYGRRCWDCNKIGHIRGDPECQYKEEEESNDAEKDGKNENDEANSAIDYYVFHAEEDNTEFEANRGIINKDEHWLLDSGCNVFISNDRNDFQDLKPQKSIVKGLGGSKLQVEMVGTLNVRTCDVNGKVISFQMQGYYAPDNPRKLFSVLKYLRSKPSKYASMKLSQNENVFITHQSDIVPITVVDNLPFIAHVAKQPSRAAWTTEEQETATEEEESEPIKSPLFHKKMCHLHSLSGTKPNGFHCVACNLMKSCHTTFTPKANIEAQEVNEIVHVDVWGPSAEKSKQGHRYIFRAVDRYSRRIDAKCTKTKSSDACVRFLNNLVARRGKMKRLFADRGGEFNATKVHKWCEDNQVELVFTSADAPEQNAMVERGWSTVIDNAKAILYDARLDKRYWPDAVHCVIYVYNRTNSRILKGKSPFEMCTGIKPRLDHLHVFGCLTYVHTPKKRRKKMTHTKAKPMIFMGYDNKSRSYKFLNPATGKYTHSIHAKFIDNARGAYGQYRSNIFPVVLHENWNQEEFVTGIQVMPTPSAQRISDTTEQIISTSFEKQAGDQSEQMNVPNNIATYIPDAELEDSASTPMSVASALYNIRSRTTSTNVTSSDTDSSCEDVESSESEYDIERIISHSNDYNDGKYRFEVKWNGFNETTWQTGSTFVDHNDGQDTITEQFQQYLDENALTISEVNNATEKPEAMNALAIELYNQMYADPLSHEEINDLPEPERREWYKAIDTEWNNVMEKRVFKWESRPHNRNVITSKTIFKSKRDETSTVYKRKARLVARGFTQKAGVDYTETFSPTARLSSLRLFISIVANQGWTSWTTDADQAYINAMVNEVLYMEPPEYVNVPQDTNGFPMVLRILKSIYGLKQSGRNWHIDLRNYLIEIGLVQSKNDTRIFTWKLDGERLICVITVDDFAYAGSNANIENAFFKKLSYRYSMKQPEQMHWHLGIHIEQSRNAITMKQTAYTQQILQKFGMSECNPAPTPSTKSIVT